LFSLYSTPPPQPLEVPPQEFPSLFRSLSNTLHPTTTTKNPTDNTVKSTNNKLPNATFFNQNKTDNKRTEQRLVFHQINALLVKMYVYAAKHVLLLAAEMQRRRS